MMSLRGAKRQSQTKGLLFYRKYGKSAAFEIATSLLAMTKLSFFDKLTEGRQRTPLPFGFIDTLARAAVQPSFCAVIHFSGQ